LYRPDGNSFRFKFELASSLIFPLFPVGTDHEHSLTYNPLMFSECTGNLVSKIRYLAICGIFTELTYLISYFICFPSFFLSDTKKFAAKNRGTREVSSDDA
jgi:hypothetical protein